MTKLAFNETGGATQSELYAQALKLIARLQTHPTYGRLNQWEADFVDDLGERLEENKDYEISMRQIYKLRDILEEREI